MNSIVILHLENRRLADVALEMGSRSPTRQEVRENYRAVWWGTLDIANGDYGLEAAPVRVDARGLLERLWLIVERGGPTCPIPRVVNDPRGPLRSFMTGDVVVLDGVAYYCAAFGWQQVPRTRDEALEALVLEAVESADEKGVAAGYEVIEKLAQERGIDDGRNLGRVVNALLQKGLIVEPVAGRLRLREA